MPAPHVIVTGASGYLGRHVVRALLDEGADVTAVVRHRRGYQVDERAREVELDLFAEPDRMLALLDEGADAVVHLAWEAGFAHNDPAHLTRLSDHFALLGAVADRGIAIVAMGSMHEVGYHDGMITPDTPTDPRSLYGIAKDALRRATLLSLAPRTRVAWLRGYYTTGDDRTNQSIFTKLLAAAESGRTTFPFTSGTNRYDFIDVAELGRQIAAATLSPDATGIIDVCSGEPVSLGEKVEAFIAEHALPITLEYGAFPDRPYDSPCVYGDPTRIREIMAGRAAASTGEAR